MKLSRFEAAGKRLLCAGFLVAGCSDQQAKGVGLVTENGAKAGAAALQQAAQVLGRGVKSVKQGLSEAELSGKVHARILWDKPLAGSPFSIDAEPGGLVKLSGRVETEELHRRLIDLVSNTVGVREVVDAVEIGRVDPRNPRDTRDPVDSRDLRDTRDTRPVDRQASRDQEEFFPRR